MGMATRGVAAAMAVVMLAVSGCAPSDDGADGGESAASLESLPVTAEDVAMVDALRALDKYRQLGGYTPVDGIGDEAMVSSNLVARVGNYFVYVELDQERYGLPYPAEQLAEIGRIIVGRL